MAELKNIMERNDFTVELLTTQSTGNTLSRAEIDQALIENGFTGQLPRNVTFFLGTADNKIFQLTYFKTLDKYGYEKLTVK